MHSSTPQQKLENDMMFLGKKIKLHEENFKFLRTHKNILDDEITDKQVVLGKYYSSTEPKIKDGDLSRMQSEEATIRNIMKHEKSAATIFCELRRRNNQSAHIKDVLGVVATLGKVNDDNLGWLLSEYLGLDNMLSLVCITYDGIKALATYDKDGSINKISGLYGFGTAIRQPLEGRFNVICLENMRLQVYKTRTEMVQALPCIYDGAISLDGGMIKRNGVYSLGSREEIDVKFPITSGVSYLPNAYVKVEKEMNELKWRRKRMMEDIQREETALAHVKHSFEVKKQEFLGVMAQSSPYTMPYPVQITPKGRSTPR